MDNPYPICENCIFVGEPLDKEPCQECNRAFLAQRIKPNFVSKRKPKTNADRLRTMSDEELAEWLERIRLCCSTDLCGRNCPFAEACYSSAAEPKETLDWLRQEVE